MGYPKQAVLTMPGAIHSSEAWPRGRGGQSLTCEPSVCPPPAQGPQRLSLLTSPPQRQSELKDVCGQHYSLVPALCPRTLKVQEARNSRGRSRRRLALSTTSWQLLLLWTVGLTLMTQPWRVSGRQEASVQGSQCSYTLVVNEFDASKCPTMQRDASHQDVPWALDSASASQRHHKNGHSSASSYQDIPLAMTDFEGRRRAGQSGGSGDKEVDMLKSQVRELEGRLLEEMVRSRELNATLTRHSGALKVAQAQLEAYGGNFTALYRALVFVQRQLAKQRKVNKSLNKKLSNVLLDVQEVHNVMARGPLVLSADGQGGVGMMVGGNGKSLLKDFEVQSVSKVRACTGATDKAVSFRDCAEVYSGGHTRSGVYYVKPATAACPVPVWCDMDTPPGGWLLLQRRQDGSLAFNRDWAAYKDGFGNVGAEHWLGNDNIFLFTNQGHYQLRVDLWDFTGNRVHALYSTFRVSGERDFYQLTLTGYSGSAQDSLFKHNKMSFSTPDRDNDGRREAHCALEWDAGWWFNNCWHALLNGQYYNRSDVTYRGIAWNHWKREQLRRTEMKIRPLESPPPTAVAEGEEGNE